MDMSSLSNGLPRPSEDPSNIAFKEAALSLTKLYKASQGARREGYLDALDELYNHFLSPSKTADGVNVTKLSDWVEERRRKPAGFESCFSTSEQEDQDIFETEPVSEDLFHTASFESSPLCSTRQRILSPIRHRQHIRLDTNTINNESGIGDGENRDRRDRERSNGIKRRVVGAVDTIPDLHKRGRFD